MITKINIKLKCFQRKTNDDLFDLQVHTRLLTHKWHELLVLTTSAYQAIHGPQKIWNSTNINDDRNDDSEFNQEVCRVK